MFEVAIFGLPVFTIRQQVLSPYHAMGCNPVSMVDPLGLQYFAPQTPMTVQDPAALARAMAPTLLKHMPGGGLWDLSNMNRYITQLPKELRAEAWMMYLSGGAIGGVLFKANWLTFYRKEQPEVMTAKVVGLQRCLLSLCIR